MKGGADQTQTPTRWRVFDEATVATFRSVPVATLVVQPSFGITSGHFLNVLEDPRWWERSQDTSQVSLVERVETMLRYLRKVETRGVLKLRMRLWTTQWTENNAVVSE